MCGCKAVLLGNATVLLTCNNLLQICTDQRHILPSTECYVPWRPVTLQVMLCVFVHLVCC